MSGAASSASAPAGPSEPAVDVDAVISKLLEVRGSRPGKQVNLAESDIRGLCTAAREIFMNQPVLLELEAPIKICGARQLTARSAAASSPELLSRAQQ